MQFTVGLHPAASAPCTVESAAICISSTSQRCLHVLSKNGRLVMKFFALVTPHQILSHLPAALYSVSYSAEHTKQAQLHQTQVSSISTQTKPMQTKMIPPEDHRNSPQAGAAFSPHLHWGLHRAHWRFYQSLSVNFKCGMCLVFGRHWQKSMPSQASQLSVINYSE